MEINSLRLLLAFFAGIFLTSSGSLSQNTTQNSLASPSTLGFDAMAVFAVLVSHGLLTLFNLNIELTHFSFLIFNACFLLTFLCLKGISLKSAQLDMKIIILIGLGFNLFIGAIFSVVQFLFIATNTKFPTGLWFGSFKFYQAIELLPFICVFLLLIIFLYKNLSSLRLISIGIPFAKGVGVEVAKTQRRSLFVAYYLTGVVICYFGVFSFISLVFPHILRLLPFIKSDMRKEFTIGALIGGLIMMLLDFLVYNFDFYGAELPVGMISSVLGSFMLISLLGRNYFKSLQK
mgnify:CR=1 FL=1|tara:strand:- start:34873 stop:35742 length:870 start_codon:yes stop_codon:yes gene_type:complete